MKVLLDEPRVFVTYGSASVFCGDDPFETDYEPDDLYAGQENGLCGAAVPGVLQLTVGTHTGWVPFRVELHAGAPGLDDSWEEIVEVSFRPTSKKVHLLGLDAETPPPTGISRTVGGRCRRRNSTPRISCWPTRSTDTCARSTARSPTPGCVRSTDTPPAWS